MGLLYAVFVQEYSKPVQSEGKPLLSGKLEHQQVDKPLYKIQNLVGLVNCGECL